MILVNDLKPGTTFENEGNIYSVLNIEHNKTAMRQMIVKVKVKNLRTGVINEISFTGGDKVEQAHIDKKEMQYLYDDGDNFVFMDNDTYEQIEIPKARLEWEKQFMKENDNVTISMYEGNEILGVILPDKVELQIVECEPAVKGDTATSATKNAKLETGLDIRVPLFIQNGEMVHPDIAVTEHAHSTVTTDEPETMVFVVNNLDSPVQGINLATMPHHIRGIAFILHFQKTSTRGAGIYHSVLCMRQANDVGVDGVVVF